MLPAFNALKRGAPNMSAPVGGSPIDAPLDRFDSVPMSASVPARGGFPGAVSYRTGWTTPLDLVKSLTDPGNQGSSVTLARSLSEGQLPDGGWAESSRGRESDIDSSVVSHLALATFLRRAAHAEEFPRAHSETDLKRLTPDAETLRMLESSLAKSWKSLSGKVPSDQAGLLGALPRKGVLEKVSAPTALLAESLLGDSLEVRLEPEAMLTKALSACEQGLRGEPLEAQPARGVPWGKILAGGAALGAAALMAPHIALVLGVGQLVAGVAVGWMVTSFNEAIVHEKMLHVNDLPSEGAAIASSKPKSLVSRLYAKSPDWIKKPIQQAWFGHTKIHHFRTFTKDQVTQFKTPEEKVKLDGYLAKEGREDLQDAEYGLTLSGSGYLTFQAISSPTYAVAVGAATLLGGGLPFAAGFFLAALGGEYVSKEYHRYTHKPAKQALAEASPPMEMFLKTDLSRFNVRSHFAHHEDPSKNFNLLPGADWLRGTFQKATVAQEEELRRLKLLW